MDVINLDWLEETEVQLPFLLYQRTEGLAKGESFRNGDQTLFVTHYHAYAKLGEGRQTFTTFRKMALPCK